MKICTKKIRWGLIWIIMGMILLAGCTGERGETGSPAVSQNRTSSSSVSVKEQKEDDGKATSDKPQKGRLDLTKMSATAVYSEVCHLMMEPEDYEGWTMKMKGTCAVMRDETSGKREFACIVQDATQCCSQGIPFRLQKGISSPEMGEDITVEGIVSIRKEKKTSYAEIRQAVLK